MFEHHFSLYVDNVVGGTLLLTGLTLTLADALSVAADGTGSFGLGVVAVGMLLCIKAMFRCQETREIRAFELGKRAARSMYN